LSEQCVLDQAWREGNVNKTGCLDNCASPEEEGADRCNDDTTADASALFSKENLDMLSAFCVHTKHAYVVDYSDINIHTKPGGSLNIINNDDDDDDT
jgi:hypothetical protein